MKKEEKYKDSRFLRDAEKGAYICDIVREFFIAINELFIVVSSLLLLLINNNQKESKVECLTNNVYFIRFRLPMAEKYYNF